MRGKICRRKTEGNPSVYSPLRSDQRNTGHVARLTGCEVKYQVYPHNGVRRPWRLSDLKADCKRILHRRRLSGDKSRDRHKIRNRYSRVAVARREIRGDRRRRDQVPSRRTRTRRRTRSTSRRSRPMFSTWWCPRSFVGPDGLELVSYPWYRPIKKPAAYRRAIGWIRPPWRLQLVNQPESPMVTVCINSIYGRYSRLLLLGSLCVSPLRSTSRTHAAINTYITPRRGVEFSRATAFLPPPSHRTMVIPTPLARRAEGLRESWRRSPPPEGREKRWYHSVVPTTSHNDYFPSSTRNLLIAAQPFLGVAAQRRNREMYLRSKDNLGN